MPERARNGVLLMRGMFLLAAALCIQAHVDIATGTQLREVLTDGGVLAASTRRPPRPAPALLLHCWRDVGSRRAEVRADAYSQCRAARAAPEIPRWTADPSSQRRLIAATAASKCRRLATVQALARGSLHSARRPAPFHIHWPTRARRRPRLLLPTSRVLSTASSLSRLASASPGKVPAAGHSPGFGPISSHRCTPPSAPAHHHAHPPLSQLVPDLLATLWILCPPTRS